MLYDLISASALTCAILLLLILCIIDLRTRLLPNVYVFPFAVLGVVFHFASQFSYIGYKDMLIGGAVGYGFLFALRAAANAYYGRDTLGLGDVKLMGAAGLWLGMQGILYALTIGAFAGLIHGILYGFYIAAKNKTKPNFRQLEIPAGPGFAVGIFISGYMLFQNLVLF